MCGIAGLATSTQTRDHIGRVVQRMTDTLIHRGPDDEGLFVADGVGLGMRRLSIIDVAGDFDAGDAVEVAHDGEQVGKGISNYSAAELRQVRGLKSADPSTGRMLGNFPQAYSHVGLINCALNLSRQTGPAEERAEPQVRHHAKAATAEPTTA